LSTCLQHGEEGGNDTNDTSQSSWLEAGDTGALGSTSGRSAATGGSAGNGGTLSTWVGLETGAGEGTLDDVVLARKSLVVGAGVSNVGRGLEVEGTTDVGKSWEGDANAALVFDWWISQL